VKWAFSSKFPARSPSQNSEDRTPFSSQRLADPALLDLVARTSVVEDPQLTAGYPEGIPNRVTVTLDDATTLVSEVAYPPGHDQNPLTDDQLAEKFHVLVDPVLGRTRADQIRHRISNLENDPAPHETLELISL
jgi:2-methylcitrate dehydratase